MLLTEFSDLFDVFYNNITSNAAPGLNEYEKSVFLTRGQEEVLKNYFTANSKGNNTGQGYDDSAKRQIDFSMLMKTYPCTLVTVVPNDPGSLVAPTDPEQSTSTTPTYATTKIDPRSKVYSFPSDIFIIVNETLTDTTNNKYFQVIPLRYDEYTRLMSKPYKRPLKNQAWRLINSGAVSDGEYNKYVEIIPTPDYDSQELSYTVRYVRRPLPIILGNLDGMTIEGYEYNSSNPVQCELDPILHEDILQRAVELAKIAWTATGQENAQLVIQSGQRSE